MAPTTMANDETGAPDCKHPLAGILTSRVAVFGFSIFKNFLMIIAVSKLVQSNVTQSQK